MTTMFVDAQLTVGTENHIAGEKVCAQDHCSRITTLSTMYFADCSFHQRDRATSKRRIGAHQNDRDQFQGDQV